MCLEPDMIFLAPAPFSFNENRLTTVERIDTAFTHTLVLLRSVCGDEEKVRERRRATV